ncbi:MAG: hypothetical protein OK454_01345 [Thaumarchaeota archaeon]|nr:hypothetical protein [Nitrososphaerota archaeon]
MASKEPQAHSDSGSAGYPSPARLSLLRNLLSNGGIPLDEFADDPKSARALIQSGEARLEVVVWPWGIAFHLVATEPESKSPLEAWPTPSSYSGK